jgi:hypothetical protein
MQRISDHDSSYCIPPAEPRKRAQIFSPVGSSVAAPLKREHGLRCKAQLVGHGHADSAAANVQPEIAGMRNSFQLPAPGF